MEAFPNDSEPQDWPDKPNREVWECGFCDSNFVYAVEWEEEDDEHWRLTCRCPDCEVPFLPIICDDEAVGRYDEQFDASIESIVSDLRRLPNAPLDGIVDLIVYGGGEEVEPIELPADLSKCAACDSSLIQLKEEEELSSSYSKVVMCCPDCEIEYYDIVDFKTVGKYKNNRQLDLINLRKKAVDTEAKQLRQALDEELLLPEDF